jgi:CHAT domain-containing protein
MKLFGILTTLPALLAKTWLAEAKIAFYGLVLQFLTPDLSLRWWARIHSQLGKAYLDRVRGSQEENLETALLLFQSVLAAIDSEKYPFEWARANHRAGFAYVNRTGGDREENIEQAIYFLEKSLSVFSSEKSTEDRAKSITFLMIAYQKKVYSTTDAERALGKFLEYSRQSLENYSLDKFPFKRALIEANIGTVFLEIKVGNRAENLEIAIEYLERSLLFLNTLENASVERVQIQHNLGIAYHARTRGNRSEHLEKSLSYFQEALLALNQTENSIDRSIVQNGLGSVYLDRIQGNRGENIEIAIAYFYQALDIRNYDLFPIERAEILANLIYAYSQKITIISKEDLEKVFIYYREAINLLSSETLSSSEKALNTRAVAQNNLGTVYLKCSQDIDQNEAEISENIERAINTCQDALSFVSRLDCSETWAQIENNLGVAYSGRRKDGKKENIERAFAHYQNALSVYHSDAYPFEYVSIKNNLGILYSNSLEENREENIEKAIACHREALEISERYSLNLIRATTLHHLGTAYCDRVKGDRLQNITEGIAYYQAALQIRTHENFLKDRAETLHNLGTAYSMLVEDNNGEENFQKAIACFKEALEVRTPKISPLKCALTLNNLSVVYGKRRTGDIVDNVERKIEYLQAALKLVARETSPIAWARTLLNLGSAYWQRLNGNKMENTNSAITCLQNALEIYTLEEFPLEWSAVRNNLAIVYINKHVGEKQHNLEIAISYLKEALISLNHNSFPLDRVRLNMNLGTAYLQQATILEDKEGILEDAIKCFQDALEISTFETTPMIYKNLGIAYLKRVGGRSKINLERAGDYLQKALTLFHPITFPYEYVSSSYLLGLVYRKNEQPEKAYQVFQAAIETLEQLRGEIRAGERGKEKLAEDFQVLYQETVEVCLQLRRVEEALEYVERSKTRNLLEAINTNELLPKGDIPTNVLEELTRLRKQLHREQQRLKFEEIAYSPVWMEVSKKPTSVKYPLLGRDEFLRLQGQLDDLIDRQIAPHDPDFCFAQRPIPFSYQQIQALADQKAAIIEWYIASETVLTFIITPLRKLTVRQSTLEERNVIISEFEAYRDIYGHGCGDENHRWQQKLPERLASLAKALGIEEIIASLPEKVDRLILVPHRFLHILPLHALPLEGQGCLSDRFFGGVHYTPSCQVLHSVQQRQRSHHHRFFALENPTGDLPYASIEVEIIRRYFPSTDILRGEKATKSAHEGQEFGAIHYVHYSCHGIFNTIYPERSALLLANCLASPNETSEPSQCLPLSEGTLLDLTKCLTLQEIAALDLRQCRLVTLSACETALSSSDSVSDEYIGLPSGFLLAGNLGVVGSLWRVNELATTLLMAKFYNNLFAGSLPPADNIAAALNKAQIWLRDISKRELLEWCETARLSQEIQSSIIEHPRIKYAKPDKKPFASPCFWAAFQAIGR